MRHPPHRTRSIAARRWGASGRSDSQFMRNDDCMYASIVLPLFVPPSRSPFPAAARAAHAVSNLAWDARAVCA
ncbi:hypothetical protein EON67_02180 [archaeon]|nr:MAG: hypothetical protein EON67_02180 [archaeon]